MKWQPIESAPRDGEYILIWERYCTTPFIGYFSLSQNRWIVDKEHIKATGWDGDIEDMTVQRDVTHWCLLPEAP